MCDTLAYVDKDFVLFGKNSDREVSEPQVLLWQERKTYKSSETLKCTYITIPQAKETYSILISKPTWMWGAEMGTNEFGVTIGNEAVLTKDKPQPTGLTGMDLVRLALERASSAKQACELIIQFIETYGQGGNCGYHKKIAYNNSFIIVDPSGGYVLETSGKKYIVEEIQGVSVISNGLTVEPFASKNKDKVKTFFTRCCIRRKIIEETIPKNPSILDFFKVLRTHYPIGSSPSYNFLYGGMNSPCMHAGGLLLNYQTTASWVSLLTKDNHNRHWVTATSAPCTSIFKPVLVNKPLSDKYCKNGELKEEFWWRHEKLQREVMKDYRIVENLIAPVRQKLEVEWIESPPDSESAFDTHEKLLRKWLQELSKAKTLDNRPPWTKLFWKKHKNIYFEL
ncbi:MAG: peptidase U34 [Candidatus Hydrogenedentes bacterium]|nr:peptidase U34 [Candidatus Hydrogenedentota bacterium]